MRYQEAETLVFEGTQSSRLRYKAIQPGSLSLWAYTRAGVPVAPYREYIDYHVDYTGGYIWRGEGSAIGNYEDSAFYRREPFDHTLHDEYGNYPYTVYASYLHADDAPGPMDIAAANRMSRPPIGLPCRLLERIISGGTVRYCVFGDSISTGGEAVPPHTAYFHRFATQLRRLGAGVDILQHAIGGETSGGGMRRFEAEILPLEADLVSIAYGMNDQNRDGHSGKHSVSPEDYAANIENMASALQKRGSAVLLISPCEPNPRWRWASGNLSPYCKKLREISVRLGVPLADANAVWQSELRTGKRPEDLLLNDINHPTSYGHFLYYCAMSVLL